MLEEQGFRVDFALLFDRPTVQQSPHGLANWIRMFVKEPFSQIPASLKDEIIYETVDSLEDRLCQNGRWFVDYVRLRIKATLL